MRQDSEACIRKYKVKTFGNKKNIEAVESQIPLDEEVLYISHSNMAFKDVRMPSPQLIVGAMAITPTTLYAYDMQQKNIIKIQMGAITGVTHEANGMSGAKFGLKLGAQSNFMFNVGYQKDLAEELHVLIEDIVKAAPVQEETDKTSTETEKTMSVADEIRKFKQLLDDGIISDIEFEEKKKQLLKV